jgi:hypothetical protein
VSSGCSTCGSAPKARSRARCWRCITTEASAAVLDDRTGRVDARFVPLHDSLCAAASPESSARWVTTPAVAERLRALVSGEVPLTHVGVDTLPAGLGREHLRERLMAAGILPERDKYLAAFDRWAAARLEAIADDEQRRTIRTYLHWHQRRRLREKSETGRLHESAGGQARQQVNVAVEFLAFVAARGRSLERCRQADIDDWFAAGTTTRWAARSFLAWAIDTRHCPRLRVPHYRGRAAPALSQQQRLGILHRLFIDESLPAADRVAGSLVLLYAQPLARVRQLRVDDLRLRGGEVSVRIGDEWLPLPEPIGRLALHLRRHRPNTNTASNPDSPWLFPGRAPGQAIQAEQLGERLARAGISRLGRLAALNHLVAEIPAPVLAKLIGYSPNQVAQHAVNQRVDWARYAALEARELRE